jgi:hypothetical protein
MKIFGVGVIKRLVSLSFVILAVLSPLNSIAESDSGSVGLAGRVNTSPPNVAPVIVLPKDQVHHSESQITISGTCQNDLLIKIYINSIFGGAVICTSGEFSIEVNIFSGKNEIIARSFDNLDQSSPDSNIVIAYLDSKSSDLHLSSKYGRRSINPGEKLTWPITVSGGKSPYAISIDWGDDQTSLKSVLATSEFSGEHSYRYPGIYKVVVRAVDIDGARAILHLVAVSNGIIAAPNSDNTYNEKTVVLWWPMILFFGFMIITFWLGQRHERRLNQ